MGKIGVIGGSGLYEIKEVKILDKKKIKTPFGDPSSEFIIGSYEGKEIVFLPRHDLGHKILPSELNYRANIFGMKKLGVERLISLSACGSFKEELKPKDIVIPDQFFDRTNMARKNTFFGEGIVAHIAFSEPVCGDLSGLLYNAAKKTQVTVHKGGTYVNMEGPAFSTRAESLLYKSWGMDVIGMTNMAEAKLAREAEICYATACFVTDYDAWREAEEAVTVEMIIENFKKNIENAKKILKFIITTIPEKRTCMCRDALKNAIITDPKAVRPELRKKLELIIGKYIK